MKNYILFMGFFLAVASSSLGQHFAYVNSAAILAEMPDVKQADATMADLQAQLEKQGKDMTTKFQNDITALEQKIERGELSPKQQADETQKLENQRIEINTFRDASLQKLNEKRAEVLQPITDKINEAIKQVAKEKGYKMIFDQAVLLYGADYLDVSQLVKQKLGF